MESQLSTDTRALDAHKAWHLLGVLLTIGRPVSPTELASRCTSFRASPEFVAFLCSIYRSPLLLTESGSVSISPIGYIEFRRIIINLGNHSIHVPRMRVVFSEPQRLLDDVACRCYRKRSRDGEIEYLPAVKKRALLQNLEDSGKEIVLSTCNGTDKAAKEVHINRITQESSLVMTCSSEEYDKTKVAATSVEKSSISLLNCILNNNVPESQSNMLLDMKEFGYVNTLEQQINFPDNENFMHLLDARQTEVVEADMLHQEPSPLPSKLHCPVFLVEDKMSAPYSRIGINLNDPYIPEVDECMDMSLLEAYNTLCACETVAKSGDVERVRKCREEEKIVDYGRCKMDVVYLSTKPINMDMTKPDDYNYNNIMRSNEVLPFLDEENTTYKTQAILSAELRSVNKQQEQYKIDKRSSSKKQKLRLDFQEKKRQGEDSKRHKSKEISGKPVSMIKNQVECKSFPNFDSFTVEEKEGSGGYGTVYRAKRKQDGLTLAIKCPHDNSNRHHIYNEMKMLERFGGKNFIIKYEGSFKYENVHCLVLEHVEHDRPEVLKKEINASQVQWYGYCLFRALASLHKQGVVHRDVKPGNFLFSCNANKGYLIDFNLAVDLHQKHGYTNKSTTGCDMGFNNVQLSHVKSLPPSKGRKFSTSKAAESINQEAGKGYKSSLSKNFKKTYHNEKADLGARSNVKSQGADGSGITSAKDATSSRLPSGERLREPMPCQGRKELISLAQEAMQGPTQEVVRVPASKRKRVAASPEIVDKKLTYLTPMPLIFTDAGHMKNKGESKQKREGPCAGTKGFRAPEVLFRSPYQGPKLDIWSAGVTLLYLITGRSPFVGDPDQNIKEIAKLRGSEDLWEVAKLHNRESSFPMELFDMKYLPSKDLRDWCGLNTKKPDVLQDIPMPFFDLIDKCLTVNPRSRISAEEALKHEFFAPCHRQLRKHRLLRQGLSLDSKTTLLSIQPDTIETL